MASIEVKRFETPDETRPFEGRGKADVVNGLREVRFHELVGEQIVAPVTHRRPF